jgi:hypothetical protein
MLFSFRLNRTRATAPRRRPARQRLHLEVLEARTVPWGNGLAQSLVALDGATPTPVPLPVSSLALTGANSGGPMST